jgi:hypothetical protein
MGKQLGKTEKGTWYCILQDAPNSFHISVSKDNLTSYDHLENPTSVEQIHNKIRELEDELFDLATTYKSHSIGIQ